MARQHGGESTRAMIAEQSNLVMLSNRPTRPTDELIHLNIMKHFMKLISLFVFLLMVLFAVGACVLWWRLPSYNAQPTNWLSSGPTVESVRRIAELLTLRVPQQRAFCVRDAS